MKTFLACLAALLLFASIAMAQIIPRRGFSLGIPPLFAQSAIGQEVPKEDTPKEASEEEGPSTLDKVMDTTEEVAKKTFEAGKEYFEENKFLIGLAYQEVGLGFFVFGRQHGFTTGSNLSPRISVEFEPSFFSDQYKVFGYRFFLSTAEIDLPEEADTPGDKFFSAQGELLFFQGQVFSVFGSKKNNVLLGIGGGGRVSRVKRERWIYSF